ncbi:hypothetical protein BO70DRAFT_351245 [Aspergillus heteromorphus CBS 117.55]|uniref:DUF7708 domain-containing protein n=1 Tax=Aspergillus heteromorphus CBS 117.55 TaxID=1448321 RepID=A0A317WMX8_9EURO|nr:uncharacterized protein BO70DRAFT_351245 [Aspergillus heteromorphus CBS 117.55]PWY86642.1 hypothetical protein BO70DRAFT_351245 [Aspergillus heteromorphus CBS 117.55]
MHSRLAERQALEESQKQALDLIKEAYSAIEEPDATTENGRFRIRLKALWTPASETVYQYSQVLDLMAGQAPEYVALAYGAIKILLTVQINHQEAKEKIQQYLKRITAGFELTDHLLGYMPTARLIAELSQAYNLFVKFQLYSFTGQC